MQVRVTASGHPLLVESEGADTSELAEHRIPGGKGGRRGEHLHAAELAELAARRILIGRRDGVARVRV